MQPRKSKSRFLRWSFARQTDVKRSKTMDDTPSENVRNLGSRVTEAGKAIGERVQSATAATAAAAGQVQKIGEDATGATTVVAGQAGRVLDEAGEAARHVWSQASGAAEDVVDAGRRATRSVSEQIREHPLIAVLIGSALGYIAALWIHGGGTSGGIADNTASAKAHSPKEGAEKRHARSNRGRTAPPIT
jgi:hypothetical protein